MPDTELKFKAVGVQETKKSFKDIQDAGTKMSGSFVQVNKANPFSEKNQKLSNREMLQSLKTIKDYGKTVEQLTGKFKNLQTQSQLLVRRGADPSSVYERQESIRDQIKISRLNRMREIAKLRAGVAGIPSGGDAPPPEEEQGKSGLGTFLARKFGPAAAMAAATATAYRVVRAGAAFDDQMLELSSTMRGTNEQVKNFVGNTEKFGGAMGRMGAMGYTALESASALNQFSRAGIAPNERGAKAAEAAMRFQREGTPIEAFLGLTQARRRGGKDTTGVDIMYTMKDAVDSGVTDAIGKTKFVESVTGLTETIQQRGANADTDQISRLLRAVGSAGGPMLQANLGANVLQQVNQSFSNPGGGIAGRMMMARVGGLGKGKSWWQSQIQLAKGISDPDNLANLMEEARSRSGGNADTMAMILNQVGGVDVLNAQRLANANKGGKLAGLFRGAKGGRDLPMMREILENKFSPSMGFVDKTEANGSREILERTRVSAAMSDAAAGLGHSILTSVGHIGMKMDGIFDMMQRIGTKLHIGVQ